MLEGERAKDTRTHSQEEAGPGMFLSERCFSLPTLYSQTWPILSGGKMKRSFLVLEVDCICLLPSLIVSCESEPAGSQVEKSGWQSRMPIPLLSKHGYPFQGVLLSGGRSVPSIHFLIVFFKKHHPLMSPSCHQL